VLREIDRLEKVNLPTDNHVVLVFLCGWYPLFQGIPLFIVIRKRRFQNLPLLGYRLGEICGKGLCLRDSFGGVRGIALVLCGLDDRCKARDMLALA
jgi:hypothetical protein